MIITAGIYKGRKILTPDENVSRPTLSKVRMGVFNTLYSILGDFSEKTFIDVFGGSGIMGLEALSRGFKEVKVFEKDVKSADIIKRNYNLLGLKADLRIGDSIKLVKNLDNIYDVAYIDPPYEHLDLYKNILSSIKSKVVVVESLKDFSENEGLNYKLIKSKKYGNKVVTYLEML